MYWNATHGFNPKSGIYKCVAETGEHGSGQRQTWRQRQPDQRQTRGFQEAGTWVLTFSLCLSPCWQARRLRPVACQ